MLVIAAAWLGGCYATIAPSNEELMARPDALPPDAESVAIDAPPVLSACAPDSTLSVCLSFDQPQLTSPYSNEGVLPLSAQLANVTRTSIEGGGAALFGATSTMAFPPNTQLVNIVAIDARIRLDAGIAVGARMGIIDADNATPGMSLFVYAGAVAGTHRVRCSVGGPNLFVDTTLSLGVFTVLRCTCEAGMVTAYRDGVKLGELAGCAPASGTTNGLQIGQNSRAGISLPPNEPLIGAIDRLRLWTALP